MNALLVVDINTKKEKSRFIKTAPSTFAINPDFKAAPEKIEKEEQAEKQYAISENISSKQKGDIAEARIAELITLYGETNLSCYKPISDDEGIDLIVKQKGTLKTMYFQIKSRFGTPEGVYTAQVKASAIIDNHSMGFVFCFFDTSAGDVWNYLWLVPATDFLQKASRTKVKGTDRLVFVAGRKQNESNKWDNYLIDKRDLANQIIAHMKRI